MQDKNFQAASHLKQAPLFMKQGEFSIDNSIDDNPIFSASVKKQRRNSIFSGRLLILFLRRLIKAGKIILRLIKNIHSNVDHSQKISKAFAWIGFIFGITDMLRVPFIYLRAWIHGKKIPFNLTNNAEWAYIILLFNLSLVSLLLPAHRHECSKIENKDKLCYNILHDYLT